MSRVQVPHIPPYGFLLNVAQQFFFYPKNENATIRLCSIVGLMRLTVYQNTVSSNLTVAAIWGSSSEEERLAVNQRVIGSNPIYPATRRMKCNGFAPLFWEQVERFNSYIFHHSDFNTSIKKQRSYLLQWVAPNFYFFY